MNAELSLGPFCNWFLPSCLDIWSSSDGQQVIFGYGARSSLCLANVVNKTSIVMRDSINVFNNNKTIISSVKFNKMTSNGRQMPYIFIGSNDGNAAVMDCQTNELLFQTLDNNEFGLQSKKILSVDWSHSSEQSVVYYCIHSLIIGWNLKTGLLKQLMIGENYENKIAISCISASNCGKDKLAIGYMNGDITIIYLESLENLCVEYSLPGHNDDICGLAFSWSKGEYEDGFLASVSRDGFVKVWDIYSKINIADVKLDANKTKHKNWFSLAVLPNSDLKYNKFELLIGSGNGDMLTIEIPSKPPSSKIRVHKPSLFNSCKTLTHSTVIFSIAIDVKNMLAITTSLDHQIIVWDLIQRKAIDSFHTITHGVHDISISPIDPTLLAIAIGDGFQIIKFGDGLNIKYQKRYPIFSKIKDAKGLAVVWHPEYEQRLAIGSSLGEINVIDIRSQINTRYSTKRLAYDKSKIYCLIWGPALDESQEWALYCVHQSGQLYVHFPSTEKIVNFTHYVNENKKRSEIRWKTSFTHLAVGNENGSVDIFQHRNKLLSLRLRINAFRKSILCLKWNSNIDEETCNWLAITALDNNILCYSLNEYLNDSIESTDSVETIAKPNRRLRAHSDRVSSISWCPFDYNKLVSVSYDRTIQIWFVPNEEPLINFRGHRGILYCVQWSAFDSDLIFSGGEDNYFHAWRPSKQSYKTPHSMNGVDKQRSQRNEDFYWPHIEDNDQSVEQTISDVLNDCINRVSNGTFDNHKSDLNLNHFNGLCVEECDPQKQKPKNIKHNKKKTNKENKKLSLFPLNNSIENCSTKYQKMEDIEAVYEKLNGINISDDRLERILLYGDCDDIRLFVKNEVSHHQKHGNREQRDILNLLVDIKSTVEESIEKKEINSDLIALSMSVSRNLWKESCKVYAQQLANNPDNEIPTFYKLYKIEMSAIYSISQNSIKEAIDLLVKNELYREALIIAKLRFDSDREVENIMTIWAHFRENNGDYEGAAKCFTAIKQYERASTLLYKRNDQQFHHTACLLLSKQITSNPIK